ncbi:hypothetical protein CC85DRAFT_283207 [Cutaneotrichosporon oleaginosum]|uniref:Uncharacterized protein n=1 Tax=Cutaneotrichosporon oleaginosum TaxID=879819 RepID=A0A0J0XV12_9TREE|nr:uncharacterized protein CC85DRAFT_283207 [Cutaneotrichosporon oleaginosum]KLT44897.1 hypothetical protein CC85DRAFT_283207 [Cutaneotrichosporon oleaginosum]TXT12028.1 hypothetical protein COLE_02438 [Cutaneotrichosporon oleaginosum]
MDTPNTRARRKRELRENDERGSGVGWQLDDRLRKELLMQAAADDPLPLPAPTQRPLPIGSSSLTGDKPALKRPRRLLRGTRSESSPAPTERTKLDELLDKIMDQSSQSTPVLPTPLSRASTSFSNTGSASRSQTLNDARSARPRMLTDRTNGRPVTSTTSLPAVKSEPQPPLRATKSAPRSVVQLASTRPVRSSPRRGVPIHAPGPETGSSLALRGLVPGPPTARAVHVSTTPMRQSSRSAPPPRAAMATRSTPQRCTAFSTREPLPAQPSSDGDTSIDSLDIAFECGGEDIERLFQVMDTGR